MWTILTFVIACAGSFWIGMRYERANLNMASYETLKRVKANATKTKSAVAGMDEDELDALVYGPSDRMHSGDDSK